MKSVYLVLAVFMPASVFAGSPDPEKYADAIAKAQQVRQATLDRKARGAGYKELDKYTVAKNIARSQRSEVLLTNYLVNNQRLQYAAFVQRVYTQPGYLCRNSY